LCGRLFWTASEIVLWLNLRRIKGATREEGAKGAEASPLSQVKAEKKDKKF